mmetsp:Transcript_65131/g.130990  ORF Transcript_65131/g.130990 Transcript_65131/m.130990 type:complete len:325 (+) Transcript_65131:56-1030(+)
MSLLEWALEAPVTSIASILLTVLFVATVIAGDFFTEKAYLVLSDTVGEKFYIWNLYTAGFLETNLFKFSAYLAWLTYAGRQVEGALGVESMAIFVNAINLACGVLTSTALFSLYVLFRQEVFLFMSTYGFGGLAAALAVALKLLKPKESPLPALPAVQHQHLPMLLCLCSLISWAAGLEFLAKDTPFVVVGTYCSWWYLRFVQRHPETGFTGDASEEFAFVTLFPPGVRRYLTPLADFCYGVCVLLGHFKERKKMAATQAKAATLEADGHAAMLLSPAQPVVELDPVAERRRAKAREQLDAKLAAMAANDEDWDDDDGNDGGGV